MSEYTTSDYVQMKMQASRRVRDQKLRSIGREINVLIRDVDSNRGEYMSDRLSTVAAWVAELASESRSYETLRDVIDAMTELDEHN